jgi:hypothetical protein
MVHVEIMSNFVHLHKEYGCISSHVNRPVPVQVCICRSPAKFDRFRQYVHGMRPLAIRSNQLLCCSDGPSLDRARGLSNYIVRDGDLEDAVINVGTSSFLKVEFSSAASVVL